VSEANKCFFRVLEQATEDVPVSELPAPLMPEAFSLDDPNSRICTVGNCALTAAHVIDYMLASGNAQPRRDLDDAVAPECKMLDIPHQSDADFLRIQEGLTTEGKSFIDPQD